MSSLLDIAARGDVHGATARALLAWVARWAPELRSEFAADDARPARDRALLGSRDRWHAPMPGAATPDALEPCRWRASRDAHCQCFRCTGQEIETLLARAIVAPCPRAAEGGCYWCRHADSPSHYAEGIVDRARTLAHAPPDEGAGKRAKGGAQ